MSEKKKREWWPIGIVMAMLTFIGGVLFAVTIMVRNNVPLTSEDYYAQEIAYQDRIDKTSRGMSPEKQPQLKEIAGAQGIEIQFPGYDPAVSFSGKATFVRPSDPKKDFQIALHPDTTGLSAVSLEGHAAGLWVVEIEWQEGATPYYYEQQWMR